MKAHPLIAAISSDSFEAKAGVLDRFCAKVTLPELLDAAAQLHAFARSTAANAHQRARALFQAYAIYRFFVPRHAELPQRGEIPFQARAFAMEGRFGEAIELLQARAAKGALSDPIASALASAYQGLAFQVLANEVQRAVRELKGNRWMFRTSHPLDYPVRLRRELLVTGADGRYPVLTERTPVRMDLTHSGYSDIFPVAMDYPEGARVLNISVDLAVFGRNQPPAPPIRCSLRVIEQPLLRLCSVDLRACADLHDVADVFDYGRDDLALLKAAVVASGIVPSGFEGSEQPLSPLLERLLGPDRGLEIISQVTDIPKGSRLAVSTNLLASLITLCMRASSQIAALEGPPSESERRSVAGRAILGEWLGGSGGGWQDSGGIWPGIKVIEGVQVGEGDVEFGSSRGHLLPFHAVLGTNVISEEARQKLQSSLVVVHGGMAANAGPILEMVTERFLLGTAREWQARQSLLKLFDSILQALRGGHIRELGRLTTQAFDGPLQAIIPGVSNLYTERLIAGARDAFGERFWGFWMMGGMAGGGMGFIFDPVVKTTAEGKMLELMRREKQAVENGASFAMDPVVYRIAINEVGTTATLHAGTDATLSSEYYLLMLPHWLQDGASSLPSSLRNELEAFSARYLIGAAGGKVGQELIERLLPGAASRSPGAQSLTQLLAEYGFDPEQHETLRADLKAGRIGLSQNRLPLETSIEDARLEDVVVEQDLRETTRRRGEEALRRGAVAVVTLAAGAGSRWTQGAGTVKALHPFAKLGGRFRTFVEVHLAKTRQTARTYGQPPAHVFTTGHLTHRAMASALEVALASERRAAVHLSPAQSIGLRLVPTRCDLDFSWHPTKQQKVEARKQKALDGERRALLDWALRVGPASDYRENAPAQCVYPLGHWYEVANLLLNGTLKALLERNPKLDYLLLHNIDTLGATLEPRWLGQHIETGRALSFEVVRRRFEDRGGGLARVGGRLRLIEGLALPREEDEAKLSYYNSLTTWISIDPLLALFGLTRQALREPSALLDGVRMLSARMPTYVTLKEVKRRWGSAREDTVLVTQFEKLWGDMSALPEANVGFFLVPRARGQQLKELAQLDAWWRDGSREYLEGLCDFS